MPDPIPIHPSSGNVFADLGLPNADELLAESERIAAHAVIKIRGREIKVRVPPPISDKGLRVYKAILDNAEAMRLRDAGRE